MRLHTPPPLAQVTEADLLRSMFEKYAVPCIDWVVEGIDGDDLVGAARPWGGPGP